MARKIANPGVPSPFAIGVLTRVVLPLMRVLHRSTLDGTEHLPERGAFLLVGNHPVSCGVSEFHSFMALYVARFGASRPLAGFAHATFFDVWPLSAVFPHIGAIPSTYDAAYETLDAGVPIAVFPGGDHETFRELWKNDEVDFAGRVGFLRIARKAWVPIVPMGFHGAAAPMLWRSPLLSYFFLWPRLAGVKRYGLSVLAVAGAALILAFVPLGWPLRALLAWAWAAAPLSLMSWLPVRIRIRIGAPIAPETLFGPREENRDGDDDVAQLRRALALVERAVQAVVTR